MPFVMRGIAARSRGRRLPFLASIAVWSLLAVWARGSVAIDPNSPSIFYFGRYRGSFLRSDDAGKTWAVKSAGLPPRDVKSILAIGTPTILYAATNLGIYKSTDRGESWAAANAGLGDLNVGSISGSRSAPSLLYATTASGLYRSSDAGATWTLAAGLPGAPSLVEADPTNGSIVYAGVSNTLYRSSDSGETWAKTGTVLPIATSAAITAVAIDPNEPSVMLISEISTELDVPRKIFVRTCALFASRDRGNTSSRISTPFEPCTVQFDLSSVAYISDGYDRLSTSSNHGDTWSPVQSVPALSFAASSSSLDLLAEGAEFTTTVLFLSEDHGSTWIKLSVAPCLGLREQVCLADGRFLVSLNAYTSQNPIAGRAVPLTRDAGAFWVFSDNNIELVVKIVDGRSVNDHYWLFVAQLTDVFYELEVVDVVARTTKSYIGYQGEMRSFADLTFAGPPPAGEASRRK